jgi:hypothetical protein
MRSTRYSNDGHKRLVLLNPSQLIAATKEPAKLIMCGRGGAGNYRTFYPRCNIEDVRRQTYLKSKTDCEHTEPYKTNPRIARILRRLQIIRFERTRGHKLIDDESDWDEKEEWRR